MDAAINIDNYITSDPFLSLKPEQTVHEPPATISNHSSESPAEFPVNLGDPVQDCGQGVHSQGQEDGAGDVPDRDKGHRHEDPTV